MPDKKTPARLAKLEAVANYLDVSEYTVRRMIARGEITGYRVGSRLLRVDMNEIDAMLKPIPSVGNVA